MEVVLIHGALRQVLKSSQRLYYRFTQTKNGTFILCIDKLTLNRNLTI